MSSTENLIEGERPLLLIREHWIRYTSSIFLIFLSWLLYFLCTVASLATRDFNHVLSTVLLVVGHVLLLLFHHGAFYLLFSKSVQHTLLTNRRILSYDQSLWQRDHLADIPLWRVRALEVERSSVIQHVLDYGAIILNRGELPSLWRVPHPQTVHTQIVAQMQEIQKSIERQPRSGE